MMPRAVFLLALILRRKVGSMLFNPLQIHDTTVIRAARALFHGVIHKE
jgi:hypothetical protein